MSDTNALKLIEVGTLLAALVAFVWWQLRDLKREERKRQSERGEADDSTRGSG